MKIRWNGHPKCSSQCLTLTGHLGRVWPYLCPWEEGTVGGSAQLLRPPVKGLKAVHLPVSALAVCEQTVLHREMPGDQRALALVQRETDVLCPCAQPSASPPLPPSPTSCTSSLRRQTPPGSSEAAPPCASQGLQVTQGHLRATVHAP